MKEKNFICANCKRKLSLWDILKLSNGFERVKLHKCSCGAETYFKDSIFLRVFPAIFAAIVFSSIKKNVVGLIIFSIVICFLLFVYFLNVKRIAK